MSKKKNAKSTPKSKNKTNGKTAPSSELNSKSNAATRVAPVTKPKPIHNVCVYCGSGSGTDPIYAKTARTLGSDLAKAQVGLVYGGGGLGLMGEVARATIKHGGTVTGIIPTFLSELEHMLEDVDELIVTDNMHERKQLMFEKSDAFVALPGGIGTLEELVEQLTWSQLGQHRKPVVVANIKGYWTPFLDLLAHMKVHQFIREGLDVHFRVVNHADDILPAIVAARKEASSKPDDNTLPIGETGIIAKL